MFILIDNYDSFTYNLFHYLGELGARLEVHRNDKISVDAVMAKHPQGIILSPAPARPTPRASASISSSAPPARCRSSASASATRRSARSMAATSCAHRSRCTASSRRCTTPARACFATCRTIFNATRYHSLTIDPPSFPSALGDHRDERRRGDPGLAAQDPADLRRAVPSESIASEHGHKILANFLQDCGTNIRTDLPKIDRVA